MIPEVLNASPNQLAQIENLVKWGEEIAACDKRFYADIDEEEYWRRLESLFNLAVWIVEERFNKNFDLVTVVSSKEGMGKTTMGWWLCQLVSFLRGTTFSFDNHIAYTSQQFIDMLNHLERCEILFDEGTKGLYKRDSQNTLQKEALKKLSMCRFKYLMTVICSPRFIDLDEGIREWRMELWIHVKKRGYAVVYTSVGREETADPWNLKDSKLREKSNPGILETLGRKPPKGNKMMVVECPPMPPSVTLDYDKVKRIEYHKEDSVDVERVKSSLFGMWLAKSLGEWDWDIFDKFREDNFGRLKKPFGFQTQEKMIKENSKGKFSISDTYIKELVNELIPLLTNENKEDNTKNETKNENEIDT